MEAALNIKKVALVTASSQGLGLATAVRLAKDGFDLAISGRTLESLNAASRQIEEAGGQAASFQSDLAKPEQSTDLVSRVMQHYNRLDLVIINSGHMSLGDFETLTDDEWYHAFELLLMSAVRITRQALPAMRVGGGGDIVFVTSATIREPMPARILSTVMRLGVSGLAKSLAATCAEDNIRINVVAPGFFDTGRVRNSVDSASASQDDSRYVAARQLFGDIPAGRLGDAAELAEVIAFVASRKAPYLIGTTISVDGGASRSIF